MAIDVASKIMPNDSFPADPGLRDYTSGSTGYGLTYLGNPLMSQLGVFSIFCFLPRTTVPPAPSRIWNRMHLFLRWVFFFPFGLNVWKALMIILFLALPALEVVSLPRSEAAH